MSIYTLVGKQSDTWIVTVATFSLVNLEDKQYN